MLVDHFSLLALQVSQGPSWVAGGPVGRSTKGEGGSCGKVPSQTGAETAAKGGAWETEKRKGSGEDRWRQRRIEVKKLDSKIKKDHFPVEGHIKSEEMKSKLFCFMVLMFTISNACLQLYVPSNVFADYNNMWQRFSNSDTIYCHVLYYTLASFY